MVRGSIQRYEGPRGVSYRVVWDIDPHPTTGKRRQRSQTVKTKRGAGTGRSSSPRPRLTPLLRGGTISTRGARSWVRRGWTVAGSDLPRITFHGLRHTGRQHHGRAGVPPKIASTRLGHSSIGITMDLYSHALIEMQEEASDRLDAILGSVDQK